MLPQERRTPQAASRGNTCGRDVGLADALNDFSPPTLIDHIERLNSAQRQQKDNAEVHRKLAELWIQLYRARALEELRDKSSYPSGDPRLILLTSPLVLHQQAHLYARVGLRKELHELRTAPIASGHLTAALRHLVLARNNCPLLPGVHSGIAQLCVLVTDPAKDRIHVERTRRLAPGNPDLLFICGLLDFNAGRFRSAQTNWQESLALSPRYLENVWRLRGDG